MAELVERFYVFISSPSDAVAERHAANEVIEMLTEMLSETAGIVVLPVAWERMSSSVACSVQEAINNQIPDYDIYLGIMRERYGRISEQGISFTEMELNDAINRWKQNKEHFRITFYFYDIKCDLSWREEQRDEYDKIMGFRARISNEQKRTEAAIFYKTYNNIEEFRKFTLIDIYKAIASSVGTNALLQNYMNIEDTEEMHQIYTEIIEEKKTNYQSILLYVKKHKNLFMNFITDTVIEQHKMNTGINDIAYELESNDQKYRSSRDLLKIKMDESADCYNKFSKHVESNISEGNNYWAGLIRGMTLLNSWLMEHPEIYFTDYDKTINDFKDIYDELKQTIKAAQKAKVALQDFSTIGRSVRRASERAAINFGRFSDYFRKWRRELKLLINYLESS